MLVDLVHVYTGPVYRQTILWRRAKGAHRFLIQRKQNLPTSNAPNTTKNVWHLDMHTIGTYMPLSLATDGVELRESCTSEPHAWATAQRPWPPTGPWWQSDLPSQGRTSNDRWLRRDTHPLGVIGGIWGRGPYGRFLNGSTEIQEFQDDIPEAVNQMPETNRQLRGRAGSVRRHQVLFMTLIFPPLTPITDILSGL